MLFYVCMLVGVKAWSHQHLKRQYFPAKSIFNDECNIVNFETFYLKRIYS